MIETLIPFVLSVLALLIVPGPDMALVIANGIAYGRRGAFYSALGISAGGLVLALLTALIVAATMALSAEVLLALQLIGCLYLLYIAVRTIGVAANPNDENVQEPTSGNLFLRGAITNISNPKALIFFSAFIPQFIPEDSTDPAITALLLGTLLCLIGGIVNFGIGVTGSTLRGLDRVGFFGRSWSQWLIFLVFVAIGLTFGTQVLIRF